MNPDIKDLFNGYKLTQDDIKTLNSIGYERLQTVLSIVKQQNPETYSYNSRGAGRKRKEISIQEINQLHADGESYSKIALSLGISRQTLYNRIAESSN